ncbi:hypothetical protein THC_0668 [Caldimicrobium thiodismutans]|uniref:DUF3782 domain-containing protein n=1 Tax=Caldimicrobium thiodismutans TaxID=1653476 RepID=A0A0U5AM09_9BACT|nr:hypothetical protein [Caldimicrobium thiodismutans]BAU23060.1 hypothetical protein THC_0668 [Caldimicrobium thiodismutans]
MLQSRVLKSSEEIEKEAQKYPVLTFADILRALKEHPDWLEELRKIILTADLIELPQKINEILQRLERLEKKVDTLEQDLAVLKQDVEVLKQDVAILKQDVAILKQDVAILKQDVAILKQDVAFLKGEVGRLKGKDFERTIRERYYAYFGRLLRKTRLIPMEKILPRLEEAEEKGLISEEEFDDLLRLDLIVEGQIKSNKKPVILAVEVSYSLYEEDIQRAIRRANILAHLLQKEVIPTVICVETKEDFIKLAEDQGAFVLKTDY